MHQEHSIPWNKLGSQFQYIHDHPSYTPPRTSLFPRNKPSQGQDLEFFRRALTKTITDFSITERKKYDVLHPPPKDGKLFSDELRDRYWNQGIGQDYLSEKKQNIQHWIKCAKYNDAYSANPTSEKPKLGYDTGDASLAEAVKILLSENEIPPLFMLAQHPKIPLGDLKYLSWGHHFGFDRVMESALEVYILVNLFAAMGILEDGRYRKVREWHAFLGHQRLFDYPGQVLFHLSYFERMGKDTEDSIYSFEATSQFIGPRPLIHKDLKLLREYMKKCFELLYRYDMVLRECGVDPGWDYAIISLIRGWGSGVAMYQMGDGGKEKYSYSFVQPKEGVPHLRYMGGKVTKG